MNITFEELRTEIMNILSEYYENLKMINKNCIQVLNARQVPQELLTGETDNLIKSRTWKMIPSDISDTEFTEFEKLIEYPVPLSLKAYYSSFFHLFDSKNDLPSNSPATRLSGLNSVKCRRLKYYGYFPFAFDRKSEWIYCIKIQNGTENGVYVVKTERMVEFLGVNRPTQEAVDSSMVYFSDSFCSYLRKVTENYIEILKS